MIYILTEGEYSAYSIIGIYEGPPGHTEFSLKKQYIKEAGLKPSPARHWCIKFKDAGKGFHEWLIKQDGFKLLESEEIHEDSYGDFEFSRQEEVAEIEEMFK